MSQQRHLAAILFTDIVGYTALMQENEQEAVALIRHYNVSLNRSVEAHEGKVLNYYGDGSLCTFPSATEALHCAMELQKELQKDPNVPLRIGLHIGEVFFEDGKALGDGVNIASRIQSLGQANTILFSKEIYDKIRNHPEFKTISLGLFDFKNVVESIEVFALANEGLIVPKKEQMTGKLKQDLSKKKMTIRRNLGIGISLLILLVTGILLFIKYLNREDNVVKNSIAIIPFKNMSNDQRQEYFAEGMMDEILNHLYKIGGLNIVSRTSSMAYKDSKKTSKEIAKELGVGNLLEGSVQKEGDHIRIIVQLINGITDQHLWAETYDREFKDVFIIQSDIAKQIAAALKVKIDPETKSRIDYIPTNNLSAYNLYLLAKKNELHEGWKELLESVIRQDSSFAPAYADLAFSWLLRGIYTGDLEAKEVLDSALPLLTRSVQLDSNLASAHNYLAQAHMWYEWDLAKAEQEWEKFFRLNPSGVVWADNYVDFLHASGRFEEALDFCLRNRDQDKSNFGFWSQLAFSYYFMNKPIRAQAILDSAWQVFKHPEYDQELFNRMAWLSCWLGNYKQSIDNLNNYYKIVPKGRKVSRTMTWLAISYFRTGQMNETQKIVDSLQFRSNQSAVGSPAFHVAMIYSATGKSDLAFHWLDKAYAAHEVEMYWLKVDPLFSPLHDDPRFSVILSKIGLK